MSEAGEEPVSASRAPRTSGARHWGGFLASGGLAFAADAGVLAVLTRLAGLDPYSARILAIAAAMVVGWLAHRRLTFDVATRPSVREFLHYAALQWTSVALNFVLYSGILYTGILAGLPRLGPLLALFIASVAAMIVSYFGMRFGVFRARGD